MSHSVTAQAGQSPITFESGKLAKLADGAVTVRSGDTIVIVTAVSATTIKEGQDFFPLTVEYKEKQPPLVNCLVDTSNVRVAPPRRKSSRPA